MFRGVVKLKSPTSTQGVLEQQLAETELAALKVGGLEEGHQLSSVINLSPLPLPSRRRRPMATTVCG